MDKLLYTILHPSIYRSRTDCLSHGRLNPKPDIQLLYLPTRSLHPSCGSAAREKSMHSSRAFFSSLQTQQGWQLLLDGSKLGLGFGREECTFGFCEASVVCVCVLRSEARLLGCIVDTARATLEEVAGIERGG